MKNWENISFLLKLGEFWFFSKNIWMYPLKHTVLSNNQKFIDFQKKLKKFQIFKFAFLIFKILIYAQKMILNIILRNHFAQN